MKVLKILGMIMMIISIVLFAIALFLGQIKVYLLFIIPVIAVHGLLGSASILVLISGLVLVLVSHVRSISDYNTSTGRSHGTIDAGGIVFVGPIPIVFGSKNARSAYPRWTVLLLIGLIIFISINLIGSLVFFLLEGI
ncbi:MAG: DUF131 domain-containing protein [Candidatus Thermoplasmatota archaeon]|nr:DUF131 domain-containing protein [Candidatus Thermoplasmatota archaeon]